MQQKVRKSILLIFTMAFMQLIFLVTSIMITIGIEINLIDAPSDFVNFWCFSALVL